MRPEVIRVNSVSKKFTVRKDKSLKERIVNMRRSRQHAAEYWALRDVSFSVQAGESLGLAGANGSGKSTLLKVIGGIIYPNSGSVKVRGRIAALLELGAGFHPDLTGRENIFLNGAVLGMSEAEIQQQFDSIVEFSGIEDFIDTQVKFYSSGMYVRLAFSVAIHSDPDILLVDEVLAVGDEPFQNKCMRKIREFQEEGRSIILVSHSADQILEVCDKALVLDQGEIVAMGDARDAMTFLHRQYQKDMLKAQSTDQSSARIKSVEIVSGLHPDDSTPYFIPGEDLTLLINLTADNTLAGHSLLVDLETDRGRHVCGVDTRKSEIKFSKSTEQIEITFPSFPIGTGDYNFSVLLLDPAGLEADTKHHYLFLPVRSDLKSHGLIAIEPKIEVK